MLLLAKLPVCQHVAAQVPQLGAVEGAALGSHRRAATVVVLPAEVIPWPLLLLVLPLPLPLLPVLLRGLHWLEDRSRLLAKPRIPSMRKVVCGHEALSVLPVYRISREHVVYKLSQKSCH